MTLRGKLLVATPQLSDPNFARTVVLILEHGDDGAFGVVLNRPSDILVVDAIQPWGAVASAPSVVFLGGPVGVDQAIGLAVRNGAESAPGWAPLFADLGSVDLAAGPTSPMPQRFRVFVGHSGWGSRQLEGEIEEGSWFVVDADATADGFCGQPARLWVDVLRRQPGRTAWFANAPEDLSVN
jgi:putative transcriptional regulator